MPAGCALLCAVLSLSGQTLSGRRAPSFSLPDSRLLQHDIMDYRGKWLLLDFMKTDCPHCKDLSRALEALKNRLGGKADVLSVIIAPPETTETARLYVAETKITSPLVFDQGQVAVAYFKATPSNPQFDTPHLFAIDPNGQIVKDWGMAGTSSKGFATELEQLINGKK